MNVAVRHGISVLLAEMSVRATRVVGLVGGLALSVGLIYGLISNKFSEVLQDILFNAFDQFEFYVVVLFMSCFAFYQFQVWYTRCASQDGILDRLEIFGIRIIDIFSVIFIPAIAGVLTTILTTQASNSELEVFEVIFIGFFIIIYISIFSGQMITNEEHLDYAERRFIVRHLIY